MADITVITNGVVVAPATPREAVDPIADFLQESGFNNLSQGDTVIQRNGTILTIPNESTNINNTSETLDINVDEVLASLEVTPVEELTPIVEIKNTLPENPTADIVSDATIRFSGALWYELVTKQTIIIGGQGGISSWCTMVLSRMHPAQMFLYDDDSVEMVNLAGQCYGVSSIGKKKVTAMASFVEDFSDYHACMAVATKFDTDTAAGDIMMCGFDNMKARKIFFNAWRAHVSKHEHPEKCLYIDGRLAMDNFQVFCITGDDIYNQNKYADEWLFSDEEADEAICSMKQTTYCACMIGSVMVNLFTNFIANQISPMSHNLPFKTYYDANMLYFKTES